VEAGGAYQQRKVRLPGDVVEGAHEPGQEGRPIQHADVHQVQGPEYGDATEHGRPADGGAKEHRFELDAFQPRPHGQPNQEVGQGPQGGQEPHLSGAGMEADDGRERQGQEAHLRPQV
jgi:hypothetical protein